MAVQKAKAQKVASQKRTLAEMEQVASALAKVLSAIAGLSKSQTKRVLGAAVEAADTFL